MSLMSRLRCHTSLALRSARLRLRRMQRSAAPCLLALSAGAAQAQVSDLVADLNTGFHLRTSSSPSQFLVISAGKSYFTACELESGCEVWRTNGTNAGTVRITDICPGECSAGPTGLTLVGNRVYMSADDGQHGSEPWIIDIATDSAQLLADVNPGADGSDPRSFALTPGGAVNFTAIAPGPLARRTRLVRTFGSVATTTVVTTAREWSSNSPLVVLGSTLFGVAAAEGSGDFELTSVSATTPAVVTTVRDINPGTASASIQSLGVAFSPARLVFTATEPGTGRELYVSNGTTAGTSILNEQLAGAESSIGNNANLVAQGTRLFFVADTAAGAPTNRELHVSNGSAAGTVLVKEINPSAFAGSNPTQLRVFGNDVMFLADDGSTGTEVWRSNGSSAGTLQVRDLSAGSAGFNGSDSSPALVTGGFYYFASADRVFRSDGTSAGTREVGAALGDSFGISIREMGVANNVVLYDNISAQAVGGFGTEPMRTPISTPSLTELLRNIGNDIGNGSPLDFIELGGRALFVGFDTVAGVEPHVINSPGATPQVLADTIAGSNFFGYRSFGRNLVRSGNRVYFIVDNQRLWSSDGTAAGTAQLINFSDFSQGFASTDCLTAIPGGAAVLSQTRDLDGDGRGDIDEVWTSDGTPAGTVRLAGVSNNIEPVCFDDDGMAVLDNALIVTAVFEDGLGSRGFEPVRIDLGGGGGSLLRDIAAGSASSVPQAFRRVGDALFFTASQSSNDIELWRTNGTTQGTVQVADINPVGSSSPQSLVEMGGALYFHAATPANGRELYRSDGTAAGTVMLRDIQPGVGSGIRSGTRLTVSDARLYFAAIDTTAGSGARLYRSDGSGAGTVEVGAIPGGGPGNAPQQMVAVPGGSVVFSGWSAANGRELWFSNGSDAGTLPIDDLVAGARGSSPRDFGRVGDLLYFSADDNQIGREPYVLDQAALDVERVFGDGFESLP